MNTDSKQEQAEQLLRKRRVRRIIDVVIASPCIVETRFFSQPEEQDKLESDVAALLVQLEREQLENSIFQDTADPNLTDETAVGGEAQEVAEEIAAPTIGKVKPAVYDEIVSGIKTAIGNAYEDAAIIAENCTQDDVARDEPFRIAQTIRERAGLGARPTICIHCHGPITEGVLAGTWVHTKSGLTTCRKPGAAKADGIFNAEPAPVPAAVDDEGEPQ